MAIVQMLAQLGLMPGKGGQPQQAPPQQPPMQQGPPMMPQGAM
jgi:hypothetical protein